MAKDKTTEKSPEVAPEIPAPVVTGKKVSIRAVFGGPMRNPLTEDLFNSEPSKPVVKDAWINTQIEAGKLAIVED